MLTVFFILLLATGCQRKESFPIYQMEDLGEDEQILSIDGVQYQRNLTKYGEEQACYYNAHDKYIWTPADGIGEQIGVCGEGAEAGGGFAIHEIAGDGERRFLYTQPRKYYFGGVEGRLWMREDISLESPVAEMVSAVTVVYGEDESASVQIDNPVMIAALLEAYNGDGEPIEGSFLDSDGWFGEFLSLHHRDYPFLQYRISYRCHQGQSRAVFCQRDKKTWSALPEEWVNFLIGYADCGKVDSEEAAGLTTAGSHKKSVSNKKDRK